MAIDFSLKARNDWQNLSSLDIQNFCQIQAEQLTSQYPIFGARFVYHDFLTKAHQEVINYAPNQTPFSAKTLAYLRSEVWMTEFPLAFDLQEFQLQDFQSICYICPIGYKNQKPEYIQIIAHEPLSTNLQKSVQQAALLLSKYADIEHRFIRTTTTD